MRVEGHGTQVRHHDGPTLASGASHQGVVEVDADRPQPLDDRVVGPVDAAHQEAAVRIGVLHDRTAVGLRQLDGEPGDRREHAVHVETGVDRLADLAQGLELVHLARQLGTPRLELLDELDAVDRHPAWAANAETMATSRSSKGLTSLRQTPSTPTTSWSRIIGAPIVVRKPATRWRSCRPYSGSASTSGICWALRSRPTRPRRVSRSRGIGCSAMSATDSSERPTALISR